MKKYIDNLSTYLVLSECRKLRECELNIFQRTDLCHLDLIGDQSWRTRLQNLLFIHTYKKTRLDAKTN